MYRDANGLHRTVLVRLALGLSPRYRKSGGLRVQAASLPVVLSGLNAIRSMGGPSWKTILARVAGGLAHQAHAMCLAGGLNVEVGSAACEQASFVMVESHGGEDGLL